MTKLIILLFLAASVYAVDGGRFYGGLSEVKADVPKSVVYGAPIVVTEAVFVATNTEEVEIAMDVQVQDKVKSGKLAREFAQNNNGHLFGGLSENPIDMAKENNIN